jgi:hypothetical protein
LATLLVQPQATSNTVLKDVLLNSLVYLSPYLSNNNTPGAPQTLATDIRNTGSQTATFSVQATLPAGVQMLATSPSSNPANPTPSANGSTPLNWGFALAPNQTISLIVQASAQAPGIYSVPVQVQASANGQSATGQTVTHTLTITNAQDLAGLANLALANVKPTPTAEANAATAARTAATNATSLMTQARYAESLQQWVSAATALRQISSMDTSAPRLAVAQALQAAERQLCTQWGCITGSLDFSVNNQWGVRQVPLSNNIVGNRIVYNNCPAQVKDIPVTSSWINRRTGSEVQNLWDNLTIPGYNNHRRDNGWQAQGQDGDTIDVTLTAQWPTANDLMHLKRDSFQIVVLPPVLSGSVSINPTHAKVGNNVTINRSVSNSGALGQGIPIQLHITNVTKGGTLVQDINQTLTLNPGENNNGNTNWQVSGSANDQIKIELKATVSGVTQTLSSTLFKIDP